jgi:hypothetical protein
MEDTVTIKIEKCAKCGGCGTICQTQDSINLRHSYWIECSCGRHTVKALHIEDAIRHWNHLNRPGKNKPKYRCWNCDNPVSLGFATCPNCGAEIDWG